MTAKAIIFDLIASDHASKVFERVGVAASESAAEVERSQRKIAGSHAGTSSTLATVSKAAVGVGAVVAAVSLKMAGDFQNQMRLLVTGAGEAQSNLKQVSAGILRLSASTGTSTTDLAKAMYLVESAGNHGAKGLAVLKAAAQGAKADGADLQVVADALTTTLNDLGSHAAKLGGSSGVMSQMVEAVALGKMRMDDFAGSIHSVLPNATAMGVNFAQVAGALSTMTAEGISADQAAQNLNHAIIHLADPTLAQTKAMASYGLQAQNVSQNLGKRGLTGTLELIERTILQHMGPAGLTLRNAFNASQAAAHDATREFNLLPPAAKQIAQQFLAGTITLKEYKLGLRDLPPVQANLLSQWKATQDSAHGFSQQLKSGGQDAQTYTAALRSLMGDSTGLQVALHLGGEHAKTFSDNVAKIAATSKQADGNVRDWSVVQKTFNQRASEAKAAINALLIEIGTKMLPVATRFAGAIADGAGWMGKHSKAVGDFLSVVGPFVGTIVAITTAVKVWTVAQAALDVVLDDNPIGIVTLALAGLVAAFVAAYTHSATFRTIVDGTFHAIGVAATDTWNYAVRPALKGIGDAFLSVVGVMVSGVAKIASALHLPFAGALRGAAKDIQGFKNEFNHSMDSLIANKKVTITVGSVLVSGKGVGQGAGGTKGLTLHSSGGYTGDGGKYEPKGIVHGGEFVFDKESTAKATPGRLARLMHSIKGYSLGGFVGPSVSVAGIPSTESAVNRGLTALNASMVRLAQSLGKQQQTQLIGSAGSPIGGSAPGSVNAYRGVVLQALSLLGQSPALVPGVLRRMAFESGGNASVVNRTDSNWQAGHPSVGLMQVIGGTFGAYAGPFRGVGPFEYGVSTNPLANVFAGLNYALHRYGSIAAIDPRVRPVGYDSGGVLKQGAHLTVNATGKPEAVLTSEQWGAVKKVALSAVRRVKTKAGSKRYHLPIGAIIPKHVVHHVHSKVRRVKTKAGSKRYHLPIGAIIPTHHAAHHKALHHAVHHIAQHVRSGVRRVKTKAGSRRYHLPIGAIIPTHGAGSSAAARRKAKAKAKKPAPPPTLTPALWNRVAVTLDKLKAGGTSSITGFSSSLSSLLTKFLKGSDLSRALSHLRQQDREWASFTKAHAAIVKQVSAAQARLASTVQARAAYAAQITSNLSSMGDLTGALGNGRDGATPGNVRGYLTTQLASLNGFGSDLGRLRKLGLSSGLIGQIAEAGVSGGGQVAGVLAHASKSDIASVNRLEAQIGTASRNIGNATAAARYDASISTLKTGLSRLEHQEKRSADALSRLAVDMARNVVTELKRGHVRVHVSV